MHCWACIGKPLESGRVCACGGTGLHEDEVDYLRKRALRADELENPRYPHTTAQDGATSILAGMLGAVPRELRAQAFWQWIKEGRMSFATFREFLKTAAPSMFKD